MNKLYIPEFAPLLARAIKRAKKRGGGGGEKNQSSSQMQKIINITNIKFDVLIDDGRITYLFSCRRRCYHH